MDTSTSELAERSAFHIDGGWYDAHWLRQVRAHAVRTLARSAAHLTKPGIALIRIRRTVAAMPAEGRPCLDGDEVARARSLLLD